MQIAHMHEDQHGRFVPMQEMTMKKRLFIHIGMHKTGTTAIQKFLGENVEGLLEQGFLFPKISPLWPNHSPLAWPFHDLKYLPQYTMPPDRMALIEDGVDHYWNLLYTKASRSSADNIVISGEDFSLVESPEALSRYCAPFETTVIVYLRQQYAYLLSRYNQDVRSHLFKREEPLEDFLQDNRMWDFLHYDQMLAPWAKAFGKENISVGRYHESALKEGLIADFAQRVGFTPGQDWKVSTELINRSWPMPLTELKRLINSQSLSVTENTLLIEAVQNVMETEDVRDWLLDNRQYPRADVYDQIMERYKGSNEIVAREYLGLKDEPMFPETDRTDSCTAVPSAEALLTKVVPPLIHEMTQRLVQIQPLEQRIVGLESSRSWRVTAPMRRLGAWLRGLKKHN